MSPGVSSRISSQVSAEASQSAFQKILEEFPWNYSRCSNAFEASQKVSENFCRSFSQNLYFKILFQGILKTSIKVFKVFHSSEVYSTDFCILTTSAFEFFSYVLYNIVRDLP